MHFDDQALSMSTTHKIQSAPFPQEIKAPLFKEDEQAAPSEALEKMV